MKKAKKLFLNVASKASVATGVAGALLFGAASPVYAQEGWVPEWIQEIIENLGFTAGGVGPVSQFRRLVQWGLTILFVVVFVVAIIYSALAAIKFISSQGDASKLEESKGAVKAILMGFAAMIVAIVGIFVVLWVFGAAEEFNTNVNENVPIIEQ